MVFQYEYTHSNYTCRTFLSKVSTTKLSWMIEDLSPSTLYEVSVTSVSPEGNSRPSAPASFLTYPAPSGGEWYALFIIFVLFCFLRVRIYTSDNVRQSGIPQCCVCRLEQSATPINRWPLCPTSFRRNLKTHLFSKYFRHWLPWPVRNCDSSNYFWLTYVASPTAYICLYTLQVFWQLNAALFWTHVEASNKSRWNMSTNSLGWIRPTFSCLNICGEWSRETRISRLAVLFSIRRSFSFSFTFVCPLIIFAFILLRISLTNFVSFIVIFVIDNESSTDWQHRPTCSWSPRCMRKAVMPILKYVFDIIEIKWWVTESNSTG